MSTYHFFLRKFFNQYSLSTHFQQKEQAYSKERFLSSLIGKNRKILMQDVGWLFNCLVVCDSLRPHGL